MLERKGGASEPNLTKDLAILVLTIHQETSLAATPRLKPKP